MKRDLQKEIKWLLDEKYQGNKNRAFEIDVKRLKNGEPIHYIIGWVDFLNCKMDLSLKPFIPRPETEYWTEKAIKKIKLDNNKIIHCLDIFAGSGCICVALLKNIPNVVVDFVDKNTKALKQIKINLNNNQIKSDRYKIIQSDIFSNITRKYDYIFANPPYIPLSMKHEVQNLVINNEPLNAVFSGKDGLKTIRLFLKQAKKYLKTNGTIYLEFNPSQKNKLFNLLKENNHNQVVFCKDQYNKYRYLMAKL